MESEGIPRQYIRLSRLLILQCSQSKYHLKFNQLLRIIGELTLAIIFMLYKLVIISYRLSVGMLQTEREETTVPDLIRSNNYKVETHSVITEDGYCLQLHRVPGKGKPVLLIHGMMCSSYCWVTSGDSSLAFNLADAGYDVWLGNFRGTKYSRKHCELDPDRHRAFWRFSLHELGVRDVSAMISKVVQISGRNKVSLIAHSMGSTCFLILASYRPKLVKNIDLAILMAPVVEPHSMSNVICYMAPLEKLARAVMEFLGILEILPASLLIEKLTWDHIGQFCLKLQLRGPTLDDKDREMLNRICHHARRSKTSFYTILHYAQNITSKSFHAYDWLDSEENLRRYGSEQPPVYQLSQVKVPVALFWSPRDSLSSRKDMQRIVSELPRIVDCKEVNIGHLDYLWGSNVKGDIYYDVLNLLKSRKR